MVFLHRHFPRAGLRVSSLQRLFSRGLLAVGYLNALAPNPKQRIPRPSQSSLGEGGLRAEAGIEGEKEGE